MSTLIWNSRVSKNLPTSVYPILILHNPSHANYKCTFIYRMGVITKTHPAGLNLTPPWAAAATTVANPNAASDHPHHPQCQCPPGPGHALSPCQPHAHNPCPCPSLPDLTMVAEHLVAQRVILSHLVEVGRK